MTAEERDRLLVACARACLRTLEGVAPQVNPLSATITVLWTALAVVGMSGDSARLLALAATADALRTNENTDDA